MLRFLVDESLPRAVSRRLVAAGHDVEDARDIGLRGQPDEVVYGRAIAEGRVVLAADLDFANALRFPPGTHPGIVVLRVPDDWGSELRARRLEEALASAGARRLARAITVVEPTRIRVFARPSG